MNCILIKGVDKIYPLIVKGIPQATIVMTIAATLSFFLLFVSLSNTKDNQNLILNDNKSDDNKEGRNFWQYDPYEIQDLIKNLTELIIFKKYVNNTRRYCQHFKTCSDCNKSTWHKCVWCHNYGCTDESSRLCPKLNLTNHISRDDLCPKIYHVGKGQILIPSGVRSNIKVKLHAPDPVILDKEIICQIKLTDRLTHLTGIILGDTVYCYPVILSTKTSELVDIGTVELIWGGFSPLSNEIPIIVYKCEAMGFDCETCRMIPIEYGCGWCDHLKSCVIGDKCSDEYMKWTFNRMSCDDYNKKLPYV